MYVAGRNWSQAHWRWIREQRFDVPPLQRAFEATLFTLEQALARQAELDKEIEALAATVPYREPVGLDARGGRCARGRPCRRRTPFGGAVSLSIPTRRSA